MTTPTVPTLRPTDALLNWLTTHPVSEAEDFERTMTPSDLQLFRDCIPVARRLVVFSDPFCSAHADKDVDALHKRHDDIERADVMYTLGIVIGLELAAALEGLR